MKGTETNTMSNAVDNHNGSVTANADMKEITKTQLETNGNANEIIVSRPELGTNKEEKLGRFSMVKMFSGCLL